MPTINRESTTEAPVFVITMYRYGNKESHSYVLGVWSTKEKAVEAGMVESLWRGGKYEPDLSIWEIDSNEFDRVE